MKKLTLTAISLVASLICAGVQAKTWNDVKVSLVGTADIGGIYLKITDVSATSQFTDRVFHLAQNIETVGLAVGLAGVSSRHLVKIQSNVDEVDNATIPTIQSIYLSDQSVSQ